MMKSGFLALLATVAAFACRGEVAPLRIDPDRSRVDIAVKATVDSFVGKLEAYQAEVCVEPVKGEVVSARFAFRFADVKTGKADRDEQMHAWQDTEHHPDGVFTLASITRGEDGRLTAAGTLRLHDLAREIRFPVSVFHDGGRFSIDGEATLDTRDFGLPVIKKFLVLKVDPAVRVSFHLQGVVAEGNR